MPSKEEIKEKARQFLEAVFHNFESDENLKIIQEGYWWSMAEPGNSNAVVVAPGTVSMSQQGRHEREVYNSFGITTYYQTQLRDVGFPEQSELHAAISDSGIQNGWISFGFLLPLIHSCCNLPNPFDLDNPSAQALLDEFAEVVTVHTSTTTYRDILVYVDLGGEPIEFDEEVLIRPISDDELYELSQARSPSTDYAIQFFPSDRWSILEIKIDHASEGGPKTVGGIYELRGAMIAAFGLAKVGNFTLLPVGRETNFGPNATGRLIQGSQLPREFGRQIQGTLGDDSRNMLVDMWPRVKEIVIPGSDCLALPLRRLVDGLERSRLDDKIVDFSIGLEALLTDSVQDELSYRFALRGSVILGELGIDRQQAFTDFKELYNARSKIVHGSSTAKLDLRALASNGERLLRDVWNWYFSQDMTLKGATARIDRQILGIH